MTAPAPRSFESVCRPIQIEASWAPNTFMSYSESSGSRITNSTDSPS